MSVRGNPDARTSGNERHRERSKPQRTYRMNAVVYDSYGPSEVLRLKDVAKPSPKDNEVLVRVHAASVNAADWRMMRADPFLVRLYAGLVKPTKFQTLGADIAGRVEEQSTLRPDPWG
jgi:NADPH:quinone reductase-like Zn-dependent oxidoreductase